ncbi:Rap1a/Tai family immunity protein [Burkholderia sp. LMU1-1-1.1]|uniref:Rap1a/Tai family immunity protein n=1 Tax=Burkholderia sp. LMU1-1-1.1 TaxID=3135266 RepID=UPI003449FCB2
MKSYSLLFAISLCSSTAQAGYVTGFDLNTWGAANERIEAGRAINDDHATNNKFYGYVMGVHDALDGIVFCSPNNAKAGQILAVVKKYLQQHPELWSKEASLLAASALKEAFACKNTN